MTRALRRAPLSARTPALPPSPAPSPALSLAFSLALLLAGCVSPAGIDPAARTVEPASLGLRADVPTQWPRQDWWTAFGDPGLTGLITRALEGNPTLGVAAARIARAQAGADFASADREPQANAALDSTRQRFTRTGFYPAPLGGSFQTNSLLTLNVGWELDFFGRHQAALDAALGQAAAAQADLAAARALIASQVARAWFQWAALREQRSLAQDAAQVRERQRALIEARVRAGLDSELDLRPARAEVPMARQRIESLDERIALVRNALAALSSQPAQAIERLTPVLPQAAPVALPESLPLDLVGRRADIAAARWRVQAALKDRDAQAAQFYPNVNLNAFAGLSSLGLSRLVDGKSVVYGAGPAIRLPIFDAGRLRASLRARTADLDAAVESYNATLSDAVRDVADQLETLRALARQRTEQRSVVDLTEGTRALAAERQRKGLSNQLPVLGAELAWLGARQAERETAAREIDTGIHLIRALGGGFDDAARAPQH